MLFKRNQQVGLVRPSPSRFSPLGIGGIDAVEKHSGPLAKVSGGFDQCLFNTSGLRRVLGGCRSMSESRGQILPCRVQIQRGALPLSVSKVTVLDSQVLVAARRRAGSGARTYPLPFARRTCLRRWCRRCRG